MCFPWRVFFILSLRILLNFIHFNILYNCVTHVVNLLCSGISKPAVETELSLITANAVIGMYM